MPCRLRHKRGILFKREMFVCWGGWKKTVWPGLGLSCRVVVDLSGDREDCYISEEPVGNRHEPGKNRLVGCGRVQAPHDAREPREFRPEKKIKNKK